MWTPNMGSKPVVKMLAHPSAPLTSLAISRSGQYMVTAAKDAHMKVWDIRNTYKCVYDYFNPTPASALDFSDSGLFSVSFGQEVQVWKNVTTEKQKAPYMKHKTNSVISALKFIPFEDVLGIGHGSGYSSIVIPGSGEANFDAFENNPFEQKKHI
jgi:U3 small nucleolar RNA-associated protein 7